MSAWANGGRQRSEPNATTLSATPGATLILRKRTEAVNIRDYHKVLNMSAALHCYVVTNSSAICNKDNRAYIVDYIGRYFKTKESMLSNAADEGEAEARAMRPRNQAISAALDADIKTGRIARDDFGWFVPDALEPSFDKYPNAPDSCSRPG